MDVRDERPRVGCRVLLNLILQLLRLRTERMKGSRSTTVSAVGGGEHLVKRPMGTSFLALVDADMVESRARFVLNQSLLSEEYYSMIAVSSYYFQVKTN